MELDSKVEAQLTETFRNYLPELTEQVNRICALLGEDGFGPEQCNEVAKSLHLLKGVSGFFGLTQLSVAVSDLEHHLKGNKPERVPDSLLEALRTSMDKVIGRDNEEERHA